MAPGFLALFPACHCDIGAVSATPLAPSSLRHHPPADLSPRHLLTLDLSPRHLLPQCTCTCASCPFLLLSPCVLGAWVLSARRTSKPRVESSSVVSGHGQQFQAAFPRRFQQDSYREVGSTSNWRESRVYWTHCWLKVHVHC